MDFLQILALFEKYNIPFKANDRDENYPLIFSGGPVMFANPEPYCEFFSPTYLPAIAFFNLARYSSVNLYPVINFGLEHFQSSL